MNKNRYRLIFNQHRNLLMAVAEHVASSGKSNQEGTIGSTVSPAASTDRHPLKRLTFSIMRCLGMVGLIGLSSFSNPAYADIIADPMAPANQRPIILNSPNSVPLVNIQMPSAAGVSRNTYSQFDVNSNGAILNNSRTNVQTRLGGFVQGNPYLATGSARIILNEVNTLNPSLLHGYVEVAGSQAQVVIANPAGISCNGCGFINASRATLTTGSPILSGGDLMGYRATGGIINISGSGLDASQTSYTDIIARAVHVNAGLFANRLNIITGANQTHVNSAENTSDNYLGTIIPTSTTSNPTPGYALDVAALGGMYAGKIHMIGTEAGLGVRNAGHIGASVGEVVIDTNGMLANSATGRITSAGNTQITTASYALNNSGTLYAKNDILLSNHGDLNNHGLIGAQGNTHLIANSINSSESGIFAAGLNADGSLSSAGSGDLTIVASQSIAAFGQNLATGNQSISAQSLDLSSSQTSGRNLTLTASNGNINAANANLETISGSLSVNTTHMLITDGANIAANQLNLAAHDFSNRKGKIIQAGSNETNIFTTHSLDNTSGSIASNGNTIFTVDDLNNQGGQLRSGQSLTIIGSAALNNNQGLITSNNRLDIVDHLADSANNMADKTLAVSNTGGTIIAGANLNIDSKSLSGDGKVLSNGNLTTKLTRDYVHTGAWQADGNATFVTTGTLTNQAKLLAGQTLNLTAGTLDNRAGAEMVGTTLHLAATDTHTLTNRGLIDGQDTFIDTITLNNLGTGRIYGDHVAIAAITLNNNAETVLGVTSAAVIAARERLDIGAQTITNREHALIFSAGDMAIGGSLDATHQAIDSALVLNNHSASIETLGNLNLNVAQINNTNEHFSTHEVAVSSTTMQEYQLAAGDIVMPSDISSRYQPDEIRLFDCEPTCASVILTGDTSDQFYRYDYTRTITETQIQSSDPGQILAGAAMQITANQVLNDKSKIMAGGALTANIGTLTNSEVAGTRTTTDTGIANYFFRIREKGRDSGGVSITSYNPAANLLAISLAPTSFLQNTAPSASGTSIAARTMHSVNQAAGAANVTNPSINLISPNISIPDNNLFRYNPDPKAHYLIETDPQFANYRTWLSSNYLLSALAYNPALTTARLGDGFYEQKLVREQIAQLTGRRFLTGYTNDEAQYQALMQNGITVAKTFKLTPGVALTASQVAQLTSDIVWLVQQTITLADGSTTQALVPQVYVRTKAGDLSGNGALISADTTNLHVAGDLNNTNGTIAGRTVLALNAYNVNNLGGRLTANDVSVAASNDLNNLGGQIDATNSLVATAGHDLNVISTTSTQTSSQGSRTNINRMAGLYVTGNPTLPTTGLLVASSGHDIHLDAAQIVNIGADNTTGETAIGGTSIQAAHDLSLGSVTTSEQNNIVWNSTNHLNQGSTLDNGTTIQTNGNIQLQAGNDANIKAASVTSGDGSATNAGGSLNVVAGNSINLTAGQATQNLDETAQVKSHGFLSSTTTKLHDTINKSDSIGSSLSADSITLQAGGQNAAKGDININGSNVVATQDTTLNAANNITITAAQNTDDETHLRDVKKSGLLSSGGIGFTIGSRQLTNTNDTKSVTNTASTVGSIAGNVNINAGLGGQTGMYTQTGSDVLAPKGDVNITAQQVDINAATNSNNSVQTTKFKQTGITLAVTSPVISAIQTAQQMVQAASQTKDTRMQALAAGTTALSASNALDAIKAGQGSDMFGKTAQIATTDANGKPSSRDANAANQVGGINISISLGTSQNSSTTTQTSDNAQSSHVTAGNNIHIKATGDQLADDSSNPDSGNIYVIGSQVKANHNVSLDAQNNLNLHAAQNVDTLNSKNSGSSASLGVSFGTDGLLFTAGLSGSKGKAKGNDISYTETQIQSGNKAGESVTLTSGKDTNLIGAQVSGNQVIANVGTNPLTGGNLNIQSLQDLSDFNSKQQSIGGSISVGYGKMGGSFNYSDSKTNSHYASVNEQSGMMAGDGGFQVKVNGNTNLTGAVMASTDKAIQDNKNSLTTQTLTTSNIENKADYKADSMSAGAGVGTNKQPNGTFKNAPTASAGVASDSGNANSVTLSGISGGTVSIGNNAAQTSLTGTDTITTIAMLNRDVKVNANGDVVDSQGNSTAHTITPIFDQQKVARETQAAVTISQAFSQVAPKAVGDYASLKLNEANAKLVQANDLSNGLSNEQRLNLTSEANDLNNAWGETGYARIALHTAIGGLTGNLEGAIGAGATALTIPMIVEQINKLDVPAEVKQALIMSAGVAIGSATGGTAGAGSGLSEVANNYLTHTQILQKNTELAKAKMKAEKQGIKDKYQQLDDWQQQAATDCIVNGTGCSLESRKAAIGQAYNELRAICSTGCDEETRKSLNQLQNIFVNNLNQDTSLTIALIGGATTLVKSVITKASVALIEWITPNVNTFTGSKILAQYGPLSEGPLPQNIASTFRSGTYTEAIAIEPVILYRAYGGSSNQLGAYWTRTPPSGPVQSIIDSALDPQWGNTATNVVKIEIPVGTTFYEGFAGRQGGLVGGGNQVLFPKNFKIDSGWIR